MFNLVLYAPEIPANTGNIGRTCVLTGTRLHLIEPLGFSLGEHALRRAGLGYWPNLDVTVYRDWADFAARNDLAPARREPPSREARLHLLTKKARKTYAEAAYGDGDYLVLGSESSGIPEDLLACYPESCERIPMLPDSASLGNRTAWEAREEDLARINHAAHAEPTDHAALREQDICGNFIDPDDYRISALNLSNAAAIVLYEALRQTGFASMRDRLV